MEKKRVSVRINLYERLNQKLAFLFKPTAGVIFILGVVASVIQLVDYFTPDPFEELSNQISEYQRDLSQLKPVDIPDSLMNDDVRKIRSLQQEVLMNSYMFSSMNTMEVYDMTSVEFALVKMQFANCIFTNIYKLSVNSAMIADDVTLRCMYVMISTDAVNVQYKQKQWMNLLENVAKEIDANKSESARIKIVNKLTTSKELREFVQAQNAFIVNVYTLLNAAQISKAYGVEINLDSLSSLAKSKIK